MTRDLAAPSDGQNFGAPGPDKRRKLHPPFVHLSHGRELRGSLGVAGTCDIDRAVT